MSRARLADAVFLLAHDEFSGRLLISPDLLGCGLVGAQLADLVLAQRIGVVDNRIVVLDHSSGARGGLPGLVAAVLGPGEDSVADSVLTAIGAQDTSYSVRVWVESLSATVYTQVAKRLVALAVVRHESGGRQLLRRVPDRYPALDLMTATRPRGRVQHMVRDPSSVDLSGGVVTTLIAALDCAAPLVPDLERAAVADLATRVEQQLPPDIERIVDGVRAAAAAVSLRVQR